MSVLLAAPELPGLDDRTQWREVTESKRESEPPHWIQRFSLVSNGALSTVERTYEATAGKASAAHAVARTVDRRSAQRLFAVLVANARDCADQLAAVDRVPLGAVQPLSAVSVTGGQAAWGVVFSGPVPADRGAATVDAVAVVQVQDKVSVLPMSSIGQDYNYQPGQSPPERAIPLVGAALGTG